MPAQVHGRARAAEGAIESRVGVATWAGKGNKVAFILRLINIKSVTAALALKNSFLNEQDTFYLPTTYVPIHDLDLNLVGRIGGDEWPMAVAAVQIGEGVLGAGDVGAASVIAQVVDGHGCSLVHLGAREVRDWKMKLILDTLTGGCTKNGSA